MLNINDEYLNKNVCTYAARQIIWAKVYEQPAKRFAQTDCQSIFNPTMEVSLPPRNYGMAKTVEVTITFIEQAALGRTDTLNHQIIPTRRPGTAWV